MTLEQEIQELEQKWIGLFDTWPRTSADEAEKERIGANLATALRQQQQPLIDDLAGVGIHAGVWDLVNASAKYPEAIPILIKHLDKPYHRRIKEGIVRALTVKEAKGLANKAIIQEYHRSPKEDPGIPWIFHYRWAFGNSMRVIVTEEDLEDLIDIVLDTTNGESRASFIEAIAKLKSPKVIEVLLQLKNDESKLVAERAIKMLARKPKAQGR